MKAQKEHMPKDFERLILDYLWSRNGSAPNSQVLDYIEANMREHLTAKDKRNNKSGNLLWRKRAQHAHMHLIHKGLLIPNPQANVWAMSDKGMQKVTSEVWKHRESNTQD